MSVFAVEINDPKAEKLLWDLAELNLISVKGERISAGSSKVPQGTPLDYFEKFKDFRISDEEMQNYIDMGRGFEVCDDK